MTGALAASVGSVANRIVTPSGAFANIGPGTSPQSNSAITLTFPGGGTLTMRATTSSGTYGAGPKALNVYKNGVFAASVTGTSLVDGATLNVSFSSGDTIYYEGTKGGTPGSFWNATISLVIVETGQVITGFTIGNVTAP